MDRVSDREETVSLKSRPLYFGSTGYPSLLLEGTAGGRRVRTPFGEPLYSDVFTLNLDPDLTDTHVHPVPPPETR